MKEVIRNKDYLSGSQGEGVVYLQLSLNACTDLHLVAVSNYLGRDRALFIVKGADQ